MPELIDPRTGAAYDVPDDQVSHAQAQWGLVTPEQQALTEQYGSTAEQAKAAGKLAANVATFGLLGDTPEDRQAISVFKDQSPTLAMLTEVAGAVAPGAVGGGIAGAAMRGLGLGSRAASLGAIVAEDVAASAAVEREQAAVEGRDIEVANVVSGVPLALGVSAAARVARLGTSFSAHSAVKQAKAALRGLVPDVDDVAAKPNALSAGAKTSRARRSVGAAGAADDARIPLDEKAVRDYAENAEQVTREVNQLGGSALDDMVGGDAPTFDEVHNVGLKKSDVAGKMTDASPDRIYDFADKQIGDLDSLATSLEKGGQKAAARQIRANIDEMATAYTLAEQAPEEMAIAADRAKRTLGRLRSKYGALRETTAEAIVGDIDEVEAGLRNGLENSKTWGKLWSEKQTVENGLWSGSDGVIRQGALWQREFLDRAPGAAGTRRRGLQDVPVFIARGDIVEHALGMTDKKFRETMRAMRKWADNVEKMSLVKTELGVNSVETTPVMRLQKGIDDARAMADELENIREAMLHRGGKDIAAKAAAKHTAAGPLETAFEVAKELPIVGGPLKTAEKLKTEATGKGFFDVPVLPPRPEVTTDSARQAVKSRVGRNKPPPYSPPTPPPDGGAIPPPGPRRVPDLPKEPGAAAADRTRQAGSASVGAMAGAAGLGVAALAAHPATQLLKDINDDQAAIRERAALGLIAPATRPRPLPSAIDRFKDGAKTLAAAFEMRKDDLIQALQNPEALLAGLDDAFGDLSDTHPEVYGDLVARAHAAATYVMAEAPPSVAIGLTRPDGIAPDALAMAKFADIWTGAFAPGDVVYSVGTGDATPTQIKALKDVHPDIFDALRLDVLKAVGESEGRMPFETLRKLDVLFDVPGIAPPSMQPAMSKTMQEAWAERPGGNKSAPATAGAPTSATAKFAAGPSNMSK